MFLNHKNPVWANAEETAINLEVEHPKFGWIPFTANKNDVESYGAECFESAVSGEFGEIADYIEPEPIVPDTINARQLRLELLEREVTGDEVVKSINSIDDVQQREAALIEWEYATEFPRLNPTVDLMGEALGLTPTELDAIWESASQR